jgi:glycolate oxidase FAD binding subunit
VYASETHFPTNEDELSALIIEAAERRLPLEVCGNRTKRDIGKPLDVDTRISTLEMKGVTHYEPTELVISALSGTPLNEIEAELTKNRQEFAFEPCRLDRFALPDNDGSSPTIGGIVATNACGPRRILRGSARDHLLGIRAVNGKGEIIKAGGRVMKNVTGYDLARGLAGSWGTLAVLSELTLKVQPKSEETRTLIFLNLSDEGAVSAMCQAMGSPYEVSATVHLHEPLVRRFPNQDVANIGKPLTALRLENFHLAVDTRAARLCHQLKPFGTIYELDDARSRAFWADVRDLGYFANDWPLWRITVAPHLAAKLMGTLRTHLECHAAFEWSGGLLWVEVPPSMDANATILRRLIAEFQADAQLVRASLDARLGVDVFHPLAEANMRLIRGMKDAFDPHRLLNPGRMYPGI